MSRVAAFTRAHRWSVSITASLVAVAALAGWYVWDEVYNVPDLEVLYIVPTAAELAAETDTQTVYRVHPRRSSVTYEIEEHLAGTTRTAVGSTSGIAGDIVIDTADPGASHAGPMVVNVQQLASDESLRDRRIRHDFLESGEYPLATFVPDTIDGMPAAIVDGETYPLEISGELTVKDSTAEVTLDGTATLSDDEVHLVASTTVQLSTFDAGPIQLVGFVRTADDITLTFDIVFVDPTRVTIPTTVLAPGEQEFAAGADDPSFAASVMPVLVDSCASCHNPGGVGYEIWPLETAGDAAEVASGLALVTGARYMPPWPASDESVPFLHDRSLSEDQIAAVVAWADAGGLLDIDPDTPIDALPPTGAQLVADIDVALEEPYVGSTDAANDYRCFVVDPELDDTTWVAAYEFVADRSEVVHHALAFRLPADQRPIADALEADAPGSGWSCDAGVAVGDQFMAWAPGQGATRFPEDTAMKFDAGDTLLLQIHYHFAHSAPADQSSIRLEHAPGEPERAVAYRTFLAPAEIPCRDGLEVGPLCERSAAIVDLFERSGPFAAILPNGMHVLCRTSPDDYAHMTTGVASASCEHTMRDDVEVIAVFGHMHEIGRSFRMTRNPGGDDELVMLDIPVWNFGWQLNFEPVEAVVLRRGDTLRVECSWDRALLVEPEARYITWSERTEDEMCYSALTSVALSGTAPRR